MVNNIEENDSLYNLSFKEAMDALLEDKKVEREDWENHYLFLCDFIVFSRVDEKIQYYHIFKYNMEKKWRVVD